MRFISAVMSLRGLGSNPGSRDTNQLGRHTSPRSGGAQAERHRSGLHRHETLAGAEGEALGIRRALCRLRSLPGRPRRRARAVGGEPGERGAEFKSVGATSDIDTTAHQRRKLERQPWV